MYSTFSTEIQKVTECIVSYRKIYGKLQKVYRSTEKSTECYRKLQKYSTVQGIQFLSNKYSVRLTPYRKSGLNCFAIQSLRGANAAGEGFRGYMYLASPQKLMGGICFSGCLSFCSIVEF